MSERFKQERFAEILKERDEEEGAPEWYHEKIAKSKFIEQNKNKIWLEFEEYSNFGN